MSVETYFTPPRRFWIIFTLCALTVASTFSAVHRLSELVDEEKLPDDVATQSIIELAEANIASHLHLRRGGSEFRGGLDGDALLDSSTLHKDGQSSSKTTKPDPTSISTKSTTSTSTSKPTITGCKGATILLNTDYWGDALVWGSSNKVDTPEACCKKCTDYTPHKDDDGYDCNIWVFCGDKALCKSQYRECWLKHLAHPHATAPVKEGPEVGWTTGIIESGDQGVVEQVEEEVEVDPNDDRKYHVIISAQGSAVHWQSRMHYYWYRKMKKMCEAEHGDKCQIGGFTRLLHSGEPDDLMDEIPTFVAQTLPPEHPDHGYIVLNRPWAFTQWVRQAKIPEKYVLMGEPDHVWLKPMPNLMVGQRPAAFPFFYIEPSKKEYFQLVRKFLGPVTRKDTENIAPIGSSPTLMNFEDMKKVAPLWFNLSIAIHNDVEAVKEWGWVQEMYAFTLACYKAGIHKIDLHLKMMAQPPWDSLMEPFYILHFTYGMDYTLDGEFTPGKYGEWRFDKRSYADKPPPRHLQEPPVGMKNELVRHLIHAINEASEAIPGWDEYHKTGVARQLWDGVVKD